jgi:GxxExxY protein
MDILYKELTEKIIKAFCKVYNHLGFGFLEKVYESALFIELNSMGMLCEKQKPIKSISQR